jgi:hypothetical protein
MPNWKKKLTDISNNGKTRRFLLKTEDGDLSFVLERNAENSVERKGEIYCRRTAGYFLDEVKNGLLLRMKLLLKKNQKQKSACQESCSQKTF